MPFITRSIIVTAHSTQTTFGLSVDTVIHDWSGGAKFHAARFIFK